MAALLQYMIGAGQRARGASLLVFRFIAATAVCAAVVGAAPVIAAEIEGVEFTDEIRMSEDPSQVLSLYGMGLLRYRVIFRGYVAALYLPNGTDAKEALGDVPRRLELSYFWSIGGKDFGDAANQILARSMTPQQLETLAPRLEKLHRAYRDVEPNDRYSLTYVPDVGTQLRLNDDLLATIPGADFASAYFGIWLGNDPLDEGLRDDLLSGNARDR